MVDIWIPSLEFAQSLKGKLPSDSVSYNLYQTVVKRLGPVGELTLGRAAFEAGLLHGAFEAVWDVLAGIGDLVGWSGPPSRASSMGSCFRSWGICGAGSKSSTSRSCSERAWKPSWESWSCNLDDNSCSASDIADVLRRKPPKAMALDYFVEIENTGGSLTSEGLARALQPAFSLQKAEKLLLGQGVTVSVFLNDDEYHKSRFGSSRPDICAAFRIKREPKLMELGINNMLSMAHWLMKQAQGGAALLTDEGDILLQKENGKLKPHTGHSFWTVARAAHLKKLGA